MTTEQTESKHVIKMIDDILQYPSLRKFTEEVERKFAEIFNVERANLTFIDRFKKDFFKY